MKRNAVAQLGRRLREAFALNAASPCKSSLTSTMGTELTKRPKWGDHLVGEEARVAARSFFSVPHNSDEALRFIHVRHLFLPDNSQPACRSVFFEGRLQQYGRHVGVVFVRLDCLPSPHGSSERQAHFGRETDRDPARSCGSWEMALPFMCTPHCFRRGQRVGSCSCRVTS
jgi:hypothetical protein